MIRPIKEDRIAKFEWSTNGGLDRVSSARSALICHFPLFGLYCFQLEPATNVGHD